jgi:hypothetical protein
VEISHLGPASLLSATIHGFDVVLGGLVTRDRLHVWPAAVARLRKCQLAALSGARNLRTLHSEVSFHDHVYTGMAGSGSNGATLDEPLANASGA